MTAGLISKATLNSSANRHLWLRQAKEEDNTEITNVDNAVPIWSEALFVEKVYSLSSIRMISNFTKTADTVVLVLDRVIPINILLTEL